MAVRGRNEAEKELGELFGLFREAIEAGNRHLWNEFTADLHRLRPGTRAVMMRDFIVDELKRRLDGWPGIHIVEGNQTTLFCLGQNWVLQVHKFDEGCGVAKNSTQACLDLHDNDITQLDLPGMSSSATVVFLGYIENIADPLAPEMRLSCPEGSRPAWIIDLGVATEPSVVEIVPAKDATSTGTQVIVRRKDRKIGE